VLDAVEGFERGLQLGHDRPQRKSNGSRADRRRHPSIACVPHQITPGSSAPPAASAPLNFLEVPRPVRSPPLFAAAHRLGGRRGPSRKIRDLLDDVISVEEVKVFKASPRVYNLAPERLNVTNPELGFVSANNWDAVAAVSAGLRTFWIQRTTAEVPEELGFQPDTIIKGLTDLAPLLRG
jgi:hypothetical protein